MNPNSDPERIKAALNSLNNLLLGMQGYIGFMESSANAQNQDTTYFGPLKELVGRANQAAVSIGSALEGKADPVDSEPTQASPAPFSETTVPGKYHVMEALKVLLRETGVPMEAAEAVASAPPQKPKLTQNFFPPGSLNPGELPRHAHPQVAGFSAPPPIPEAAPAPAPAPTSPLPSQQPGGRPLRQISSVPPPIPGTPAAAAAGTPSHVPPPIPGTPAAAAAPAQAYAPAAAPTPLRPALSPQDIVQLQPRRTANIVDPQAFLEPTRDSGGGAIPKAPTVPDETSLANIEVINRAGTKGLIMLVDDEQHLLYIASRILATDGYRVINCEDVFEALHIYENVGTSVDLVILDFSMPTMNGEDAFYEFREMNPQAKVILSSGMFERDVVSRLLRKGLRAFLPKPYKRESLLQAVTTAIANS